MRWEKGKGREIPAEMTLLELAQEVQKKENRINLQRVWIKFIPYFQTI